MKVREFIVNQKELLLLASVLGALGMAGKVKADAVADAKAEAPRVDTLALLTNDVRNVRADVRDLRDNVTAMLRVQCVTNPTKWDVFETAGIKCGDLFPTQAGRVRK